MQLICIYCIFVPNNFVMSRRLIAVLISVATLSLGWLSLTGLALPVALVPLLWISHLAENSRKGWWQTFRYSLLTFVLWNVVTVWWIWNASPVGPIAATLVSSTLSMIAFMGYHTILKRAPKKLAYTFLVSSWIALEYWYTTSDISWPWLLLGNGFSNDIWAIQWYEYTGLFGGSLWVLCSNIAIFEAYLNRKRSSIIRAAIITVLPILISSIIYVTYKEPQDGSIKVTVVQPNIHHGDEDKPSDPEQEQNLLSLASEAPSDVDYIVMPECAIPEYIQEPYLDQNPFVGEVRTLLTQRYPTAEVVAGGSTLKFYRDGEQTSTSRTNRDGSRYDIFNSALYIPAQRPTTVHHKERLVIGTESMPVKWLFEWLDFLVIDLGGSMGELGRGTERVVSHGDKATIGAAICYEALYGAYYGEFVNKGAEAMFVISNDCWWDNTPGYRHLFSMSAIRAVEHRRAIARSANTGISGFISSRGDHLETLGWDKRGVLTADVPLNSEKTIYTLYGDIIARVASFMTLLSLLYYMVWRVRKRQHIV